MDRTCLRNSLPTDPGTWTSVSQANRSQTSIEVARALATWVDMSHVRLPAKNENMYIFVNISLKGLSQALDGPRASHMLGMEL